MSYKIKTDHIAITDGVDGYFGDARVYTEYGAVLLPPAIGTTAAFTSGGSAPAITNTVDKFSFSTPFTTATDVGDLSLARSGVTGQSSSSNGYSSGGNTVPGAKTNTVDQFPFASPFVTGTDSGDLTQSKSDTAGQTSSTDGYVSGGIAPGSPSNVSAIDRFPFSTPFTTATNIGSLTQARYGCSGSSSSTNGYTCGGYTSTPVNTIDQFPFSTPFVTGTDTGDLSLARFITANQNSSTDGYTSGGFPPNTTRIDRFPFSTPFVTSTNIGALVQARRGAAGQSSETFGYTSGGYSQGAYTSAPVNTIDRFPFSTPFTTATDIGDLSQARTSVAGHQD